ncbi:MAG: hypothetical protein NZ520_05590 [bacterium]|nr:hypothetical protein [bacterium]
MERTYEVVGTTEDGVTIVLETPLPVRGRVRIKVEPAHKAAVEASADLWSFLEEIHARQRARGHVPPSPEEVEARLQELRAEWRDETHLPR